MANGIVIPNSGNLLEEIRTKQLANKFIDAAEGYDNRELLVALGIAAGCTIRARYRVVERDQAMTALINVIKHCKEQL